MAQIDISVLDHTVKVALWFAIAYSVETRDTR